MSPNKLRQKLPAIQPLHAPIMYFSIYPNIGINRRSRMIWNIFLDSDNTKDTL